MKLSTPPPKKPTLNFVVEGGTKLKGSIKVNGSKNSAMGILCASLLNKGTTTLYNVPRIEEVNRILEVFESIGVKLNWLDESTLELKRPTKLNLKDMNRESATRTRSVIMLTGALIFQEKEFLIPYAGGCKLGKRTISPHLSMLEHFGAKIAVEPKNYKVSLHGSKIDKRIILQERGDTVTENALIAAALSNTDVEIRFGTSNYMVTDTAKFLQKLGIKISGINTTTYKVSGVKGINKDISYRIMEDPIEAVSFITAAIITKSKITIQRCPLDYIEFELERLREMGLIFHIKKTYLSEEGIELIDLEVLGASKLRPVKDHKIECQPFPHLNADSLPFFSLICTQASGRTLIHDWMYENRAIYLTELSKLGANIELVDTHRVFVSGPTKFESADITSPPALRPAVLLLFAMMAAPKKQISILRNVYSIARGYEDFANRLNSIGAKIEVVN